MTDPKPVSKGPRTDHVWELGNNLTEWRCKVCGGTIKLDEKSVTSTSKEGETP